MLSIDEEIVFERKLADYYKENHLKNEAEEHEQLAEWLEELKALRNGLNIKCDNLNEALEKGKKIGYNKAIDDVESEFLICDKVHYNLQDILCVINKLKAGVENERSI